ncbi:MAG TPA: multidrug effflux MFS transporter [Alphaproteobacteria bacterium]|jgi:DHA1 family bicyclomycin/chloramphenicol resistance-like MFS transporter|nr:multidrug effflux MFS transporter [Alphaproteobacteria bacterium]
MAAPAEAVRRGAVPRYIPLLLVSVTSAVILSTDLYTPSLPHLPAYFGTDAATVQLTMSLNLAAFAFGQLVLGPLSDRVGRRPVFVVALAGFALTSIAAALAPDIDSLIVARTLMGLATCAEAVLGYAVINDLYDERDSARVLSAYGMAIAITPAVAPFIGGYVHVWFGWRANFVLLAAIAALVTLLVARFLPETLATRDLGALAPRRFVGGYGRLLGSRVFMGYTLTTGLLLGGLFAFVTEGPFLLIDRLGVPTERYGLYYAVMIGGYFLSSLTANRLVKRLSIDLLLGAGLAIQAASAAALLAVVLADAVAPWTLMAPVSAFVFGIGWVFATAPVRAFGAAGSGGGHAAAMMGFVQMAGGALGAQLVGLLHDGTALPFAATVAGSAALSLATYFPARGAPVSA